MKQKVSMTDIARRLNLSQATISYVLSGRKNGLVSDNTRHLVLATAREMGYQPNRVAQSLRGRPSYLVELFAHGYSPAFYARSLYEFEAQIRPSPYKLNITISSHWTQSDWEQVNSGWPIDGAIVLDVALPWEAVTLLKQGGIPVVALGVLPVTDVDHVRIDLEPALLTAMRHLITAGKRVALLSNLPPEAAAHWSDPRYLTYRQVMQEANLTEEVIVAPDRAGAETRALAHAIVRDYIQQNGCPDAIFCFNDERAIGALVAVRELGYRVPEDVALIGHDNIDETLYHQPRLSTIHYPIEAGSRLAWQFLQHRIQHPDAPLQSATIAAEFILRESSKA